MQLRVARGDPGAALEVYRDLQQRLRQEMSADPESQTTALFQEIEAGSHPPTGRPASAATGSTAHRPSSHRLTFRQSALPAPPTPLVGREAELAALGALLGGTARLVTLTGPGGSGKTRMALETAICLRERFEGSVWLVPLLDLADPSLIADRIRAAPRLPRSRRRPDSNKKPPA
jgi:hypothetical protein